MTYTEKLRDPRWQKKRLEIMERDELTCQICGVTDKTMHTHHLVYINGREPWDYTDAALQCLCEDCNKRQGRVPAVTLDLVHSINTMIGCIRAYNGNQIHLWEVALNVAKNAIKIEKRENEKSQDDSFPKKRRRK